LCVLSLVPFSFIFAAVTLSMSDEQSGFWDDNRVISTMRLLEETSYEYRPTEYSEIIKTLIESMLFYRPTMTLALLSEKPLLFNIFFWSMYGGNLNDEGFPPDGFSFIETQGVVKLRIYETLLAIQKAIDSGLITDNEMTREMICKIDIE
jgi:hypothetical protein